MERTRYEAPHYTVLSSLSGSKYSPKCPVRKQLLLRTAISSANLNTQC